MPIIDVWAQCPGPRLLAQPWVKSVLRWAGGDAMPDRVTPELLLRAMDEAGIERALICAWWGPQGPIIDNDEVIAAVRAHPDRLVGIASANLTEPHAATVELRRCVEAGLRGLRVLPWLWELPPDHRLFYPLYSTCCDLKIPFLTQIGHTGPLKPSEPGRPIPYLERVLLDFPELVVVGGHVGDPWTREASLLLRKFPGFYIDSSAYVPKRFPAEFVDLLRRDNHRVMFGTNFPMLTPARCLQGLEELGLSPESKARFFEGNAKLVFGL